MADYNNENRNESAERFVDPAQQQPEQIDEGNQETSDFKSRDGGPVTDNNYFGAPQEDSSEGVGIPKNYEGGEHGEYNTGYGQQQQTDSAVGDVPLAQEEQKYEDNASAPGYDDKSAVGDTDGTGSFDQPTTDQTQFGTDENTNGGYDAETQPPVGETAAPPPPAETPKKESLITKLKEKLPGHHKSTDDQTTAATAEDETIGDTPPKQGLVSKIKEKIHI